MHQPTTPAEEDTTWKPAVPLWGVVYGRIFLGILEAIALGAVVAAWSALTHAGLGSDQVTGFAIVATTVRETLDATTMRLTMRIQRTNDMNATQRTTAAIICPAIGGALAAAVFAPPSLTQLTLLTWALFMVVTCTLERPWKTTMSHEEMKERAHQTRLMTREHFAEEIAEGRMTFRPIDDEGYYLDEDGNRIDED
ncbi:hypothetical protein E4J66_07265 [Actinomyces viscosus]|uniref:Uncharacterized protein n=1 Tax=Actinomyces viscosus TaxID=1656 RepID=A0A3S4WJY7_ACTVI|nr:hypothetical protein [Actinomyces viscosus]TFH52576.1 hypothetical protein E4J66_07265 [Actinomyces viscosus]VEI16310.1 Uncharacterised protein [Actinomyces viscosus]